MRNLVIFAVLLVMLGCAGPQGDTSSVRHAKYKTPSNTSPPLADKIKTHIQQPYKKAPSTNNKTSATARHFQSIRHDVNALKTFFASMPKGGDLHNHLSGAPFAETLIEFGARENLCLEHKSQRATEPPCAAPTHTPLKEILSNSNRYQKLIDAWSVRNLKASGKSGHDQFFSVFLKIARAVRNSSAIIARLRQRAAKENVQYLELMARNRTAAHRLRPIVARLVWSDKLSDMRDALLNDPDFQKAVETDTAGMNKIDERARQILNCHIATQKSACAVVVRFQTYALRLRKPAHVFAELLMAFETAQRSPFVVGVNLVGPEDDLTARQDYRLHMRIFQILAKFYPNVKISLHAGEMTPDLVPPEDLDFHITDAIHIGGAKRIGHGIAIAHERGVANLLKHMAKNKIAVEVPLTSNEVILKIAGKDHPLTYYLSHNVPVVLATDDAGILRTDLTAEFVKAAQRYKQLGYRHFKQFALNSIKFSFMADALKTTQSKKLQARFAAFERLY